VTHNNTQKETGTLRNDQNRLIFDQGFSFSGYERDSLFMNREGKKYYDIGGASGIDSITDGRAAVFADFDNDGDYDIFLTTTQGPSHLLFRNNVGQDNHWLRVILEGGKEVGRDAFGSVVRVKTSAGTLTKVKAGGSGFLSQHDPRLLFGLGDDSKAQSVEVTWPNGKVEMFSGDALANTTLLLRQNTGKAEVVAVAKTSLPDPLTKAQLLASSLKIELGEPMPNLALQTLDGKTLHLQDQLHKGHRAIVNLWATWCVPCRREMPELQKLAPSLAAGGVDLIGINVDSDPNAGIATFLKQSGVTYPVLKGGTPTLESLFRGDEVTVPLSIVLSEDGKVTDLVSGWSNATKRKFEGLAGR
jgi:thiol-disulfide isomerase/thioredoxin